MLLLNLSTLILIFDSGFYDLVSSSLKASHRPKARDYSRDDVAVGVRISSEAHRGIVQHEGLQLYKASDRDWDRPCEPILGENETHDITECIAFNAVPEILAIRVINMVI